VDYSTNSIEIIDIIDVEGFASQIPSACTGGNKIKSLVVNALAQKN
jgi:hypothetical protein